MKKLLLLLVVGLMTSCTSIIPDGDEVAVLVKKPWFFGHGGVSDTIVDSGLSWGAFSTWPVYLKKVPFQNTEKFTDLITLDNQPVDFDAYLELQIIKERAPELIGKFGEQFYEQRIQKVFRSQIREFAKGQKMFALTTGTETMAQMQNVVTEKMDEYLKSINIPISVTRVSFSKVLPPNEVLSETIKTAAQIQRRKTERERELTEKSREAAERAKAKSDLAYRNTFGMTASQYLQMISLENERLAIEGDSPVTIIKGQAVPTLNIK